MILVDVSGAQHVQGAKFRVQVENPTHLRTSFRGCRRTFCDSARSLIEHSRVFHPPHVRASRSTTSGVQNFRDQRRTDLAIACTRLHTTYAARCDRFPPLLRLHPHPPSPTSQLHGGENHRLRTRVPVVHVQVWLVPTSGRALRTPERGQAAWRAAVCAARPRAAVATARVLRWRAKVALCTRSGSSGVCRTARFDIKPCPNHAGPNVGNVVGGVEARKVASGGR